MKFWLMKVNKTTELSMSNKFCPVSQFFVFLSKNDNGIFRYYKFNTSKEGIQISTTI